MLPIQLRHQNETYALECLHSEKSESTLTKQGGFVHEIRDLWDSERLGGSASQTLINSMAFIFQDDPTPGKQCCPLLLTEVS